MMPSFDNHLVLQKNAQKLPFEKAHLPSARNLKSSLISYKVIIKGNTSIPDGQFPIR